MSTVTRAGLVLTAAAAVSLAGCAGSTDRVQVAAAIGPTFARLFVHQQHERGLDATITTTRASATCGRGGSTDSGSGAGSDWRCAISYRSGQHAVPAVATYSVEVKPNGCFTAEGDEPTDLVSAPSVTRSDGALIPNDLWRIDGCFDPG